jgi:hypothetical protein
MVGEREAATSGGGGGAPLVGALVPPALSHACLIGQRYLLRFALARVCSAIAISLFPVSAAAG